MKMKNNKFYYTFVYKSLFTNPSFAEICSKAVQLAWCQHVLDAQHCAWCQLSTVWLSARANLNSGKQHVEIMAQLEGQQRKLTCSFSYDILSRKMNSFSTNMARNKYSNIQHQVDKFNLYQTVAIKQQTLLFMNMTGRGPGCSSISSGFISFSRRHWTTGYVLALCDNLLWHVLKKYTCSF